MDSAGTRFAVVGQSLAGGAVWLARRRMRTTANTTLALHQGTFEAVLALAEKHARKPDPVRARVAVDAADAAETEEESSSASLKSSA